MPPTTPPAGTNTGLNTFITNAETQILTPLIQLIALAAFVLFVWGVVEYIRGADSDEKRQIGTQHMLWGIIGLAVMFGANAIITLIGTTAHGLFGQ